MKIKKASARFTSVYFLVYQIHYICIYVYNFSEIAKFCDKVKSHRDVSKARVYECVRRVKNCSSP